MDNDTRAVARDGVHRALCHRDRVGAELGVAGMD
jgi:hypothetical protein